MRAKLLLFAMILLLVVVPAVLGQDTSLETYTFEDLPLLGTTAAGQDILLGGFSGLYFEGVDDTTGNLKFITHTDRGPNAEPIDTNGDGVDERPFPLPDFQLIWVRFEINRDAGTVEVTGEIPLTLPDGSPLTGISNLAGEKGMAYADEVPIDLFGSVLDYAPMGGDLEGIVRDDAGTYWMADEYRPAIYHFDADGKLIARYVPEGSSASVDTGIEAFPAVYAQRRANRGFEGIAYSDGKIYAFVQSPLDNPDVANDASSKAGNAVRILEFDPMTETTTGEYLYVFGEGVDKIGDAVALGNGEFLIMERDDATGPEANKRVWRISLDGATNLQTVSPDMVIESLTTPEALADAGIVPVSKTLFVDLIAAGYDMVDKAEGLALIDDHTIAVINDNDFRMSGVFDPATGLMTENENAFPEILGIITLDM